MKIRRHYPVSIPAKEAMLCEDCKEITASKNSTCQVCGSLAIWPLAVLLEKTNLDIMVDKILKAK